MVGKSIFLIAGEASGDALGGALIHALRGAQPDVEIAGVGGERMQEAGLHSLLPMEELCVMGIAEVLEHLPRLLKLIKGMVEDIEARQPDVLVTIDLPDFNFRVAKMLKKRGIFKGKIIHYVAPTVWAWRPGRAKKVAQFLDGMMCLFPFEPEYFTAHGLRAAYVGHPLTQRTVADGAVFRAAHDIPPDVKVLSVMFGSRSGEFKMHAPIFMEAIQYIREQTPDLQLVVPTLPHLQYEVTELISSAGIPAYILLDDQRKADGIAASDAAMVVSGTAALELAYAGTPHIVGYKTSGFTWAVMKILVKSKFAHLANILLGRAAVPEFLQGRCRADLLAAGVLKLFKDDGAVAKQHAAFAEVRSAMAVDAGTPSDKAALFIKDL